MSETSTLEDLVAETDMNATTGDLDTEELLAAYGDTARLRGMIDAMQLATANAEGATADSASERLRNALTALRGRDPASGTDQAALGEFVQLSIEASEAVDGRVEELQDEVADRLGETDGDMRGFY